MSIPTVSLVRPPAAYRLPAQTTFGPRLLDSFEFVWVLAGSAEVRLDDHTHILRPGQLQLSRPGMVDFYTWRGRRCAHAFAHFTVEDFGRLPPPETWRLTRQIPANGSLTGLLADLVRLHANHQREEANIVTAMLLDRFVLGSADEASNLFATDPFAAGLIQVLRRAWPQGDTPQVSVSELADSLALSRSHTTRLAIQTFGLPPRELIEMLRLSRAATLLRRTNTPIKAIATSCGFTDQFHFAKRFRHVYQTSPSRYRAGEGDPPEEPLARSSAALTDLARFVIST